MRRESHVRFYEGGGVRFPAATRLVPLGERHLRRTVGEFVAHYHSERNHQGLGNVIPFPAPGTPYESGPIRRRERLGGLLNFYERNAA
jgi:transposase InsO family protein